MTDDGGRPRPLTSQLAQSTSPATVSKPVKVCLVLRSLEMGGAQLLAEMLARGLHRRGHAPSFLVLYEGGGRDDGDGLESSIRSRFPVNCVGKRGRWDLLRSYLRFVRTIRANRPDVIYGWLPIANLFCLAAKPFIRPTKLVVSIHGGGRDLGTLTLAQRTHTVLNLRLARWADGIIVNSTAGVHDLVSAGVPYGKISLVPNGVDLDQFSPDPAGRRRVRDEWGIADTGVVFGLVATRLEPVKGHDVFLRAAATVAQSLPDAVFVCFGEGDSDRSQQLRSLANDLGVSDRVKWVGVRHDMQAVYSAFDAIVCASHSEGGPNVVAEAMACCTPCVCTDVGSCAEMVGDTGIIVPPNQPDALGQGMLEMALMLRRDHQPLQAATRARIMSRFGMDAYVDHVLETFSESGSLAGKRSFRRRRAGREAPTK
jgi:glycosyltransferase involved in cell wall biosynthesis